MASNGRITTREVYDLVDRKFGELDKEIEALKRDFNDYKVKQAGLNAKILMVWSVVTFVGAAIITVFINQYLGA